MLFRVLGPVEGAAEGRRVALGSGTQRLILAVLLASRGGTVSSERLVDGVWGAHPPVSARKSLHSHVSRLRRALAATAPDPVVTESDGYGIDLARHELDADRFEALLGEARTSLGTDPARAVGCLDEALGLWRGAAYGALAGHELVRAEAVRLDRLRAVAAADRVDARLALGEHHAVAGELEAAVTADPLAERPHGQLLLAQYRSGRQADALATYQQLRRRLADEVGVDPSPELQRLHEQVLRQDAALAVPAPRTGPVDVDAAPLRPRPAGLSAALPADPGGLIGRDEDVAAVAALVAVAPLVTLTGPGGVGKSRVAGQVVAEVGEQFDEGVAVCGLGAVRDAASVVPALVGALGTPHRSGRSLEETLLAALGTRRLLLVLDNCEHLLEAVSQVADRIRAECPHVVVLATSREYLHLPGERVWEVTPLPVPRPDADAAHVAETPAGALLCARAGAVEPTFALTDTNAPAIAELCRRLDGIPLAIELAAARLRALAPADLVARIDHRFELLTGGSPRDAGRQRTLEAVVGSSYELLTDAEARLLDRLSVFAGPFPLAAAEQVCAGEPLVDEEVAGLLAELVDQSMVVVDRAGDGVRYRLLDTLRAYGARRLEDTGVAGTVRRAHAAHHVALAEALAPQVRGADERAALAGIDAAIDDLRVAHRWLVDAGDVDGALRLPVALYDYLLFRLGDEVSTWAERAVGLARAPAHPAYPAALATVARGAMNRGELDRARALAERALAGAEPEGLTALRVLHLLTELALYEGRLDDVLALADRRTAIAAGGGHHYYRALAGVSRVLAHRYRGDADPAAHAAEARAAAEASGNHTARAWALYSHGEALLDADPDTAAALLEQAIEAARRVDSRLTEGVALVSLASLCGRSGQTGRALRLFRDTVAHWRSLGDYTHQLTTLRNLVELLARVGADEPAAVLHGAVTAGATPSFGEEAERLEATWTRVEARLGAAAAHAAAERGRRLTGGQMVDAALAQLDALLGGTGA